MGFHAPCEASWAARQHLHAVRCVALVVGCLNSNLRVVLLLPVGGKRQTVNAFLQLSATDVSAQTTMKGAAKCDKHCDLQNSVNQQGLERILRFRDTPESMPASVSTSVSCCRRVCLASWLCKLPVSVARVCAPRCLLQTLDASSALASGGNQLTEPGPLGGLISCVVASGLLSRSLATVALT